MSPKPTNPVKRKWFLAFIFSLILGVFGVDRFYLGKTGSAILYLLTLGLFGAGCLYDLFALSSIVDDYNLKHKFINSERQQTIIINNSSTSNK